MQCNLCESFELEKVVDLGHHPLADRFLSNLDEPETTWKLGLAYCHNCHHVQSLSVVSEYERYVEHDYSYTSSNSPVALKHFKDMAEDIWVNAGLREQDLVIDVGSNVGTLLGEFRAKGCRVLGFEPSPNIARLANVPTRCEFWGAKPRDVPKARVITATNVFNHIADPEAFMVTAEAALLDGGCIVLEVPYVPIMLARNAFDTIYHEHVSYFTLLAHVPFFKRFGFYVGRTMTNDYMGGSIRVYLFKAKSESDFEFGQWAIRGEKALTTPKPYKRMMELALGVRDTVCKRVYRAIEGGSVGAVGAAAKGNTLLNFCRFGTHNIKFVADTSPLKIGKYTPGSHIPIVDESECENVSHLLILPWNIRGFLEPKLRKYGKVFIGRYSHDDDLSIT